MALPVGTSPSASPTLQELAERIRPVVLARDAVVPVDEGLRSLLPDAGLIRGSTLAVAGIGATSLALRLLAGPSRSGSWVVIVGMEDLAPVAVLEAGLDLDRVAFVDPGRSERLVDVAAALIGAVDVVVLDARLPIDPRACRRLASRCRERGSILVVISPERERSMPWSADRSLLATDAQWEGSDRGHGHLCSRSVSVDVDGRGRASRRQRHRLLLPSVDGEVVVGQGERGNATVITFNR